MLRLATASAISAAMRRVRSNRSPHAASNVPTQRGVIAYAVGQRSREIAVRLAIGASPSAVVGLFVRQGLVVIGVGLAAGLGGAVALGRLLEAELFGVTPADAGLLASASALLAVAALVAAWWPARRAARVEPAVLLREE